MRFVEFAKKKDNEKPPVKKIADYPGPFPVKPPKAADPYRGSDTEKPSGKGLGDQGDKKLVYEPKIDQDLKDAQKPSQKYPTRRGEPIVLSVKEFVEKTRNMSHTQFAEYLRKKHAGTGQIHEAITHATRTLKENKKYVGDLVIEARREGLLGALVEAVMEYPEAFDVLARMMADRKDGQSTCRRLVKSLEEMVGPPMHHDGGMHDRPKHSPMGHDDMGGHPHDDMGRGMDDVHGHDDLDDEDDDDSYEVPDDFGLDDEDADDDDMGHGEPTGEVPNGDGTEDEDFGNSAMDKGLERRPHTMSRYMPSERPYPSMMSRLMSREHHNPAVRNLLRALNG